MDLSLDFILLLVIVFLALAFDFINGFHDAANAIATVVSTKVLSPRVAVLYGASLDFLGAFLGTKVAEMIGNGMVDARVISMETVLFSLIGAIFWNLLTWYKGLPSSSSHALIGSLLGATCFASLSGYHDVSWDKVMFKVVTPMVISPILGMSLGFLIMTGLTWLVRKMTLYRINAVFGKLQILSAGLMAVNHGRNDAQKSMGIITLALVTYYPGMEFKVPFWVIVACAVAMGCGTMSGGWKIIRTIGSKMIKLQPIHGFAAETTAASIIFTASNFGIPVSTTHVISTSIMGVGATKRLSAVKWGVVGNILWAWILTIPMTFILSGLLMAIYRGIQTLF